jgi:hypothetical protein
MDRRLMVCLGSCWIGLATPAAAQKVDLDLSAGGSASAWRAAVSSQWRQPIGSHLALGAGLRLTRYGGQVAIQRNQGPVTADLPEEIEVAPEIWGLNIVVSVRGQLTGMVAVGANIDLIGVATGPTQEVGSAAVGPARGSVLQYGDRDRGSLNSEFFLAARVTRNLELRAGMSHYVTGFRASAEGSATRYLRFESVPFLAVRWLR